MILGYTSPSESRLLIERLHPALKWWLRIEVRSGLWTAVIRDDVLKDESLLRWRQMKLVWAEGQTESIEVVDNILRVPSFCCLRIVVCRWSQSNILIYRKRE